MASGSKKTISRTRFKVRIVGFNDTLTEGYVFLAYDQRLSDLLNDERDFLPLETDAGEVKVLAKRAIMEVELLDNPAAGGKARANSADLTPLMAGNAHDILGVAPDADDAEIRLRFLALKDSVSPERVAAGSSNPDLAQAAAHLARRYEAAYDAVTNARKIEAIAIAMREAQPKRRRFGEG